MAVGDPIRRNVATIPATEDGQLRYAFVQLDARSLLHTLQFFCVGQIEP